MRSFSGYASYGLFHLYLHTMNSIFFNASCLSLALL
nr:MAG TPA: hypothetical protein [Caudoviricetes sp.]DAH23896.1 MAG TPA: hypothetical protein [Bacteriophage sp.]DAU52599.1 MAG TPA: hypothetical protein [Crassvirales sp.]DAF11261.1 MAG TPA: hypothetical protein [Caudoviricetes sp.]DAF22756.1 MAG TPA: hypothetical protein [Caudoviricetes sp.]